MLDAESDYIFEMNNPGTVCGPRNPLSFESSLYTQAELEAITRKRLGGAA